MRGARGDAADRNAAAARDRRAIRHWQGRVTVEEPRVARHVVSAPAPSRRTTAAAQSRGTSAPRRCRTRPTSESPHLMPRFRIARDTGASSSSASVRS